MSAHTQFTVFRNKNAESKSRIPYLLDIQSDLLNTLETRMVIPLALVSSRKESVMTTLMPIVELEGKKFLLVTPQMTGIPRKDLGQPVCNASHLRSEVIAAIDMLVTGI